MTGQTERPDTEIDEEISGAETGAAETKGNDPGTALAAAEAMAGKATAFLDLD